MFRFTIAFVRFASLALVLAAVAIGLPGSRPGDAAFPGANGKIVFQTTRHGGSGLEELYVMNADGSNQTRCTNNSAFDGNARWSPDGTRIAFTSTRDGGVNGEIWMINADCATGLTRLTSNSAGDGTPNWSPDGTMIAFYSDRDGNPEIYKMNANGTNQTRLTNNSVADYEPYWSPDGGTIAFYRFTGGNYDIYKMNPDGTGQTSCPINTGAQELHPDWSPDGTKFVMRSDRNGGEQIFSMNSDCATGLTQLTTLNPNDSPSWSPDGTMIVYHHSPGNDDNFEVFKMNANGTGKVNLTNHPSHDSTASWQPDADSDGILPPDDLCPLGAGPASNAGCAPGPPAVGGVAGLSDAPSDPTTAGPDRSAVDYAWPVGAVVALIAVFVAGFYLPRTRRD